MILSKGLLLPAVIAVRIFGADGLVFGVAALDEGIVQTAGAFGQGLDDLDRPHLVGQVREIGGLIAGPSADLEHFGPS